MPQSPELTAFYNAYNDWLNAGAPIDRIFHRKSGLCGCLSRYLNYADFDQQIELQNQFALEGLDVTYPFGRQEYWLNHGLSEMHLDPKRIAWVKAHLNPEQENANDAVLCGYRPEGDA